MTSPTSVSQHDEATDEGMGVRRHIGNAGDSPTGTGGPMFDAIRRSVGTRPRRWLLAVTLLLGLVTAVGVAAAADPADLTLATLANPTQSLMSVVVPYLGILLVRDLRGGSRPVRVAPTLTAAVLLGAAIGVFGFLVCAAALAFGPAAAQDPWRSVGTIALGGVLVQVVAQLLGTGLGLLLRRHVVAFLASIVLPLGLWFLLGGLDVLRPAQAWLAPYSSVQNLLSGRTSAIAWAQWLVILLLWGVGLNVVGTVLLKRRA